MGRKLWPVQLAHGGYLSFLSFANPFFWSGYVMAWTQAARFVSIRGSGHLVPLNRPEAARVMLNAFTSNQDMPPYKQLRGE